MIRWYALLGIAIVFNSAANILMKAGMQNPPPGTELVATVRHYVTSVPLIIGLFLFALNVIAWTQALSKLSLSVAYPIMVSLTLLLVTSGAMVFFKESMSWIQWVGYALIICGVVCVTR